MKSFFCALLVLPLFLLGVSAGAEGEIDVSTVEDALPEPAREVSGQLITDGSYDLSGALERLFLRGKALLTETIRAEWRSLAALMALALLYGVCAAFAQERGAGEFLSMAVCAGAVLLTEESVTGLMTQTAETLTSLTDYSRAALPTVFTASVLSGAVSSAPAKYAAVFLGLDVMSSVTRALTLPLIYAYTAMSASLSFFESPVLRWTANSVKWLTVTLMSFLTLAACSYVSLTGAIAASADAAAVKAARTAISSVFPVVGGILSDTAGMLLSSAGILRSSLGVFALIGIAALCLGPFAALSVKMVGFKAVSACASALGGGRLPGLLGDLGTAMGLLLALVGSQSIFLFLSLTAAMKAVSG